MTCGSRCCGTPTAYAESLDDALAHPEAEWRMRGARGEQPNSALLDAVLVWAREHGDALRLEVHEENARAIAAYERRGFRRTGVSRPYNLDPRALEIEMSIPLH